MFKIHRAKQFSLDISVNKIRIKFQIKSMNNNIIQNYFDRLLTDNVIHEINRLKIDDEFPKEKLLD